ncbi:TRAP transporter large permease subunit [Pseudahrensia aquimaris]|uniref:TRAP transporter large permease subunit n=1 Tax=Pseudahrensia aquimaris TaxID=744461 RepID=A0ABW3FA93_9HYPH
MPLDLLLVIFAFAALWLGYSVGITLGGVALAFASVAYLFGAFDGALLGAVPSRIYGIMTNPVLLAIPLFVFMGLIVERAGLADDMFAALNQKLATRRGGLSLSVTFVGALLAASTGIVGASVLTLGLLALPTLLKRGVEPGYAGASVAAAGSLGQIIPPAIVLIVLSDQMSNAWQQVQLEQGNFAPQTVSVSDLFAAALLPGVLLAALIAVYQWFKGAERPLEEQEEGPQIGFASAVFGPLALIALVLGSILGGVATPTEAASVGVAGALLLAARRNFAQQMDAMAHLPSVALYCLLIMLLLRGLLGGGAALVAVNAVLALVLVGGLAVSLSRLWRNGVLKSALEESVHLVSMIFLIIIGASLFALVFRGLGGDESVQSLFVDMPGGALGGVLIVLAIIFLLGFFLEFIEITYLVVPIVVPVLLATPFADGSTVDPLWLGVSIALVLQTSFLTPPFGVALFYLRSVAPAALTTIALYRGVIPFVAIQLVALGLVLVFPWLATGLPVLLFAN